MQPIEYHDTTLRVRYAETDQMGVVYHSNYLIWFEVGRVEIMRALGFEYKAMETEDDCHIVVAEQSVREGQQVLRAVVHEIDHRFSISHTTVQVEVEGCEANDMYCMGQKAAASR